MATYPSCRPVIGITMGDPIGIGPEILIKALSSPDVYDICKPLIIGDEFIIRKACDLLKSPLILNRINSVKSACFISGTIDLISVSQCDVQTINFSSPSKDTGKAMLNYIIKGVDMALNNDISAMVTCPITKTALKLIKSKFHSHTELIADRTNTKQYAMMLAGDRLKVVLVTIHIPVTKVSMNLTIENIIKIIRLTGKSLVDRFGIDTPKIAVAGMNPHAGEDGMFGHEEDETISPAVRLARKEGYDVFGPLPPDTVFYHASQGRYDAVVCMYHDQGLIPFKMIHFKDGVNTTLGLPIIRTSVDHGTAYDISWKGIADPSSLIEAIKMAVFQAKNESLNK
jgi:4-phospho-D-threonate 3-dehydrogenase / 4-phospho-D-erythronate 3-dehydrogenase